jgi:transcriptional regulator with XRE-family HTH domain
MTDSPETPSAVFARNVRRLRQAHGWSQAELGRRLGEADQALGQSRVADIEQSGSVSLDQAVAFAKAFKVPLETLLYVKSPKPPPAVLVRRESVARLMTAARTLQREVDPLLIAD